MAWDFRPNTSNPPDQGDLRGMHAGRGGPTDPVRGEAGTAGGSPVGRAQVWEAINGPGLRMHFQPLVDLDSARVVAYEALARFTGHPDVPPDAWFRRAGAFGLQEELELEAVRRALLALDDLRDAISVCVNLSGVGVMSDRLGAVLEGLPLDRVVIEMTEQEEIADYLALNRSLLRYRADGLRVAVDDAGAGFASMRHIVSLQPDIIKLDASWVSDIEADPVRRAMVTALATFATSIDAVMVGEAVETQVQADVLRDIGVPWAQGYHFARPGPLQPD